MRESEALTNPADQTERVREPASSTNEARSAFAHLAQMHLDEVANLWSVWHSALTLPHYDKQSLGEIESRIQAHIAGMRLHEQSAWQRCLDDLDIADGAEIFAAAQLAFRSYDVTKIKLVVQVATEEPHRTIGLITALAWLPIDIADPWINKFFKSKQLQHKWVAVEVCRWRGEPNHEPILALLQRKDCQEDAYLCESLVRSAGEFNLTPAVKLISSLPSNFWSLSSRALMGDKSVLPELKEFLFSGDGEPEARDYAAQIVIRLSDIKDAQKTIRQLAEKPQTQATAVMCACILGDMQVIPWLVGQMQNTELSRLAGLAFTVLTGCDLEANEYHLEDPPVKKEAEDAAPDTFDESLPWPNSEIIWRAWQDHLSRRFQPGVRYLMGEPINNASSKKWLEQGSQFVRYCASFELALNNPKLGLYNTCGIQFPES